MSDRSANCLFNAEPGRSVPLTPMILLLEDSPGEAELFAEALARISRTDEARPAGKPPQLIVKQTAECALEWLQNESSTTGGLLKLVIVDLDLPGDTGIAFIRKIRSDSRFTHLPIIALASSDEQADIQLCHAIGVSEFLVTPWTFEELIQIVRNLYHRWILDKRKSGMEDDTPAL